MRISAGSAAVGGPLCLYGDNEEPIALLSEKIPFEKRAAIAFEIVRRVNGCWRPIETAPADGKPKLLYLEKPIDTRECCGYCTASELMIVVGWWDGSKWECGLCEEGSADSFGYTSVLQIEVRPSHWMPLPEPPTP